MQDMAGAFGLRAGFALAAWVFGLVAVGLVASAGLVALSRALGYPVAALLVATGFVALALAAHLAGRAIAARRARRAARAARRLVADVALARAVAAGAGLGGPNLGGAGRLVLPALALVLAYAWARRR